MANTDGTIIPGTIVPNHLADSQLGLVESQADILAGAIGSRNIVVFRSIIFVLACALMPVSARAQDPQALMNAMIQQQIQQDKVRQQNSMMRLEIERLDLEQQL